MGRTVLTFWLMCTLSPAAVMAQSTDANVLATVRITARVLADGKPLPPGTYDIRLTAERPAPLAGQSPGAQRYVEIVADGRVVAREIAEVLLDDDLPEIGASSQRVAEGTRIDMLVEGEFLRISTKRDRERYLIYLPVEP